MMFDAAPGEEAGLAYVREYVNGQLATGALPTQILASFGVGQADPLPVDTAELCWLVLKRVHLVQDEELPRALVAAAREGRVDEALSLLEAGAPWDAIDERGHSAGGYALRGGHAELLDRLLDAASRCVLGEVDKTSDVGDDGGANGGGEGDRESVEESSCGFGDGYLRLAEEEEGGGDVLHPLTTGKVGRAATGDAAAVAAVACAAAAGPAEDGAPPQARPPQLHPPQQPHTAVAAACTPSAPFGGEHAAVLNRQLQPRGSEAATPWVGGCNPVTLYLQGSTPPS